MLLLKFHISKTLWNGPEGCKKNSKINMKNLCFRIFIRIFARGKKKKFGKKNFEGKKSHSGYPWVPQKMSAD